MKTPTAYVFVHASDGKLRIAADSWGRMLVTLDGHLAALMVLALAGLGYNNVTLFKRRPAQLGDALLANGVKPKDIAEKLLFIESLGEDGASTEARVATAAALIPEPA